LEKRDAWQKEGGGKPVSNLRENLKKDVQPGRQYTLLQGGRGKGEEDDQEKMMPPDYQKYNVKEWNCVKRGARLPFWASPLRKRKARTGQKKTRSESLGDPKDWVGRGGTMTSVLGL